MRTPLLSWVVLWFVICSCGSGKKEQRDARVTTQERPRTSGDPYTQALEAAGFDANSMQESEAYRLGAFRLYQVRRTEIGPPGSGPPRVIIGPSGALTNERGDWLGFVGAGSAEQVAEMLAARSPANVLLDPERLNSGPSGSRELERQYVTRPTRETLDDGTIRIAYWTGSPPSFQPIQNVVLVGQDGRPRFETHGVQELASPEDLRANILRQLESRDTWTRFYAAQNVAANPNPEAAPHLRRMLNANWADERKMAVKALAALRDRDALPIVSVAILQETDVAAGIEMADFIAKVGEDAPDARASLSRCAQAQTVDPIRARCAYWLTHLMD